LSTFGKGSNADQRSNVKTSRIPITSPSRNQQKTTSTADDEEEDDFFPPLLVEPEFEEDVEEEWNEEMGDILALGI
jgi:hypothetical protein